MCPITAIETIGLYFNKYGIMVFCHSFFLKGTTQSLFFTLQRGSCRQACNLQLITHFLFVSVHIATQAVKHVRTISEEIAALSESSLSHSYIEAVSGGRERSPGFSPIFSWSVYKRNLIGNYPSVLPLCADQPLRLLMFYHRCLGSTPLVTTRL